MSERETLTFERLAELLAVVGDGRDGGGDLERRHRRGLVGRGCRGRIDLAGAGGGGMRVRGRVLKWPNGQGKATGRCRWV